MGRIIRKSIGMRLMVSLLTLSISLVFLGAGANQVSEECSNRKISRKVEIKQWKYILAEMSEEIPAEHRCEWQRIVSENPEMMMKITSSYRRN